MFDFSLPPLTAPVLGGALLIFMARIADMSLNTVRLILITRGMRKWAVLIGFVEVTIWVLAVSQVISNLERRLCHRYGGRDGLGISWRLAT